MVSDRAAADDPWLGVRPDGHEHDAPGPLGSVAVLAPVVVPAAVVVGDDERRLIFQDRVRLDAGPGIRCQLVEAGDRVEIGLPLTRVGPAVHRWEVHQRQHGMMGSEGVP